MPVPTCFINLFGLRLTGVNRLVGGADAIADEQVAPAVASSTIGKNSFDFI